MDSKQTKRKTNFLFFVSMDVDNEKKIFDFNKHNISNLKLE